MQLARLVRATGIGPDELLAHADITEDLLDICHAEEIAHERRWREEQRLAFELRANQAFAAAAGRARR